jgi:hypothetical protein
VAGFHGRWRGRPIIAIENARCSKSRKDTHFELTLVIYDTTIEVRAPGFA